MKMLTIIVVFLVLVLYVFKNEIRSGGIHSMWKMTEWLKVIVCKTIVEKRQRFESFLPTFYSLFICYIYIMLLNVILLY